MIGLKTGDMEKLWSYHGANMEPARTNANKKPLQVKGMIQQLVWLCSLEFLIPVLKPEEL